MTITGYAEAAFKHGVTREEMDHVLAQYPYNSQQVNHGESKNGNTTATFVGYTSQGKLIEVSVEYIEEQDWIYHADAATPKNETLFYQVR